MARKPVFPRRIAVTVDSNASGPASENLLAWKDEAEADKGDVAIYTLLEVVKTKQITKIKKQGETDWFEV